MLTQLSTLALNRDGQIQISSREETPATTVSVTGGEKLTFPQVYKANVDSCVSINVSSTKVGYNQNRFCSDRYNRYT